MSASCRRAGVRMAVISTIVGMAIVLGNSAATADPAKTQCQDVASTVIVVETTDSLASICQEPTHFQYRGLNKNSGDKVAIDDVMVRKLDSDTSSYVFTAYNNGFSYTVETTDGGAISIDNPAGNVIFNEPAIWQYTESS